MEIGVYVICITVGMLLMAASFMAGVIIGGLDKAELNRDRSSNSDSE